MNGFFLSRWDKSLISFVSLLKGKGDQFTYFLESEDESYRKRRLSSIHSLQREYSISQNPERTIAGCRKCSSQLSENDSCNSLSEKCNGFSDYCSECLRNNVPMLVSEQNTKCNTGSYEDDFRQNLENNNTRSHSNSCGFWRESEVRIPLMNGSNQLGFYGPESLADESSL